MRPRSTISAKPSASVGRESSRLSTLIVPVPRNPSFGGPRAGEIERQHEARAAAAGEVEGGHFAGAEPGLEVGGGVGTGR